MNKVKLTISAKTQVDMDELKIHGCEFKMNLSADEPIEDCCSEALVITLLCNLLSEMTNINVESALKMQREIDNLIKNPN